MNKNGPVTPLLSPKEGMRVSTSRSIDRTPYFLLRQMGLTGTVTLVERNLILVKMDEIIPGCEEWNNTIQLTNHEFGDYGNGVVIDSMIDLFHHYFTLMLV